MSKKFIYSVADAKGNVVIPFDAGYDSIEPFGDWLKVGKGKCFGLINEKGETVLPCEYEKFSHIHAGSYYFSKNNGYVDTFTMNYLQSVVERANNYKTQIRKNKQKVL